MFRHFQATPDLSDIQAAGEKACIQNLVATLGPTESERTDIAHSAQNIISKLRTDTLKISTVDALLQEYGLSTEEGVALMRLCESLIRTPDFETARALIRDKLHSGNWLGHFGGQRPPLVSAASAGLAVSKLWINTTGGPAATNLTARLGDRVLGTIIKTAMALIGNHFVLGETIGSALKKGRRYAEKGYSFSFDMLGEAALTSEDAERYFQKYKMAAFVLAESPSTNDANNISIKLSALHPRYEFNTLERCGPAIITKLLEIAQIAREGNFSVTIDAEESDRLEASLAIFERLIDHKNLRQWNGLGLVVQAYQKRAPVVIDWVSNKARTTRRRIPIRLVKGAYWDMEIKRAQELGLEAYPVYTQKHHTDISYLCCARKLLEAGTSVYPQFATHNANSAAAILRMANDNKDFEFQRLYGMGEALHDHLLKETNINSRIYAPVGPHKDLLPYLVRRLLENGANSSFVNQMTNPACDIDQMAKDPIETAKAISFAPNTLIGAPRDYLQGKRRAAAGEDWTESSVARLLERVARTHQTMQASSLVSGEKNTGSWRTLTSPLDGNLSIGDVQEATSDLIDKSITAARRSTWPSLSTDARADILEYTATLLEQERDQFISLCAAEAGKTIPDSIAEVREAIDFCRYYANEARSEQISSRMPLGVVACISPWNFPLAIFMGQVVAALAAGNCVVAKPADQTPMIAYRAIKLLHRAGVPQDALGLLLGAGAEIGAPLTRHAGIDGVCFTGSTATAKRIEQSLVETGRGAIPLIAETGGVNAMIIDSTALLEQAVKDVVDSAFQSAGQRCSACRIVCVQSDIAERFEEMLRGALAELTLGDPRKLSTDIGPVIDVAACKKITAYIEEKKNSWPILAEAPTPTFLKHSHYIAPIVFQVSEISDIREEIFGPVLHLCRFDADKLEETIDTINALGFGLTMGLHTRIDTRVERVAKQARVGNLYVNRNQIGAVVGVQPFGGEGLSGTGPKAGGPHYLLRLTKSEHSEPIEIHGTQSPPERPRTMPVQRDKEFDRIIKRSLDAQARWCSNYNFQFRCHIISTLLQNEIDVGSHLHEATSDNGITLPGPTGEINRLRLHPRGVLLLLPSPDVKTRNTQIASALIAGNSLIVQSGEEAEWFLQAQSTLHREIKLQNLLLSLTSPAWSEAARLSTDVAGVIAEAHHANHVTSLLQQRKGAISPFLSASDPIERFFLERVVTIDTTAAGGNASLLANSGL